MKSILNYILSVVVMIGFLCCDSETIATIPVLDQEEQTIEAEVIPETEDATDGNQNTEESSNSDETETEEPEVTGEIPSDSVRIRTVKILFVGNSLTYYNDLPGLLEEEATTSTRIIQTDMVAYPNYAIIDHWSDGDVQQMIKENDYDYVIIQQGPSSQAYGRQILFDYGKRFKDLCDQYGADLVYFMVWPAKVNYFTFDAVIANHQDAAEANDAMLAPVGLVWKNHFDSTGNFSYYGSDDFHPSLNGSKKASEVIAETLFGFR